MLKLIIFTILFIYIAYKVSGFILRIFGALSGRNSGATRQGNFGPKYRRQQHRQPANGNVNIDYIPDQDKKGRPADSYKGGEYVDYEEVKNNK